MGMFKKLHEWLINFYFVIAILGIMVPHVFLPVIFIVGGSHLVIYIITYLTIPPDKLF